LHEAIEKLIAGFGTINEHILVVQASTTTDEIVQAIKPEREFKGVHNATTED